MAIDSKFRVTEAEFQAAAAGIEPDVLKSQTAARAVAEERLVVERGKQTYLEYVNGDDRLNLKLFRAISYMAYPYFPAYLRASHSRQTAAVDASMERHCKKENPLEARAIQHVISFIFDPSVKDRKYLYDRFTENFPVIVRVERQWFEDYNAVNKTKTHGAQMFGSNVVIVPKQIQGEGPDTKKGKITYGPEDEIRLLVHELLHYASAIGCGQTIRWRDESGDPHQIKEIKWFHEGLTEFHAQQITRRHGQEPKFISYQGGVLVSSYLEQIAGRVALKNAYLRGDFGEVREKVNELLGTGTFETLMSKTTEKDALQFMMNRAAKNGMDYRQWEQNPIAQWIRYYTSK